MVNNQKIYAFIDSQNLNLSVQNDITLRNTGEVKYGWELDFRRFYIYLRDKFMVDRAFLFIGKVDKNQDLYNSLRSYGYEIVFKPTLIFTNGKKETIKGNVDAELVLHTMIEYPDFEKSIIVAGDGDYYCLIEYLKNKEKLLNLFIPNRYSYSSLLRDFYENMVFVSDLRTKLEKRRY